MGDSRAVGSRDPRFEVPADGHSRLVVAPADALAVLDELRIVTRLRVAPILRPCRLVPLTYYLRVEQARVLPGENLLGDQRERIRGFYDKITVTRCQSGTVMRLRPGIIGHLVRGRTRGEGLNRCGLRASGEQSAGRCGRKCRSGHLPHFWFSSKRRRPASGAIGALLHYRGCRAGPLGATKWGRSVERLAGPGQLSSLPNRAGEE